MADMTSQASQKHSDAVGPDDDLLERAFDALRVALASRPAAGEEPSAPRLFASAEEVGRLAFSPDEAAKLLGLTGAWTVRRLIQSGKLRARVTGARYIIAGSALIEFLDGSDEPMLGAGDPR